MAKLTLSDLANISGNEASAITTINNNNAAIETALENTLSRDGHNPNSMSADIDLNGFDLLNVGNLILDGSIITADTVADYVDFNETITPSSPSANKARMYAVDNNSVTNLAYKDSTGRVRFLGDDVFNVRAYGATGDGTTNDTTAVAAALTAIGTSNGVLYFPTGVYLLSSGTLSKTLTGSQSLRVCGDGPDATVLYFPSNGNGISFTYTYNQFAWIGGNNLVIEDLGFATNVANTGSAIVLDGNATIGNPSRPTIISRVGFRGTLTSNSRWANGAHITDLQNVEVNDCYYFGSVLGVAGKGVFYTGTTNAEHPTVLSVHNFQMQFGEVGIHCTGFVEGLMVVQSNFTQTNYGILVDTTGSLPMFAATGSQFNCNLVGIQLTDCTASQITGNLLFTNAASATCILANGPYHTITGNTFVSNAATCSGIIFQSGATDSIISGNVFKNFTTNIWLQAGANNNQLGSNRHADGTPVFDQATGTIYTTETSTALSPGANDGKALGTTALQWSDLFLASGGVINFNNGDVTATHSSDTLTFAGADTGYSFNSNETAGSTSLRVHNTNNANNTTKLAEMGFYGTDTISANKEACRIESNPVDSNWTNSFLRFFIRISETVTESLRIASGLISSPFTIQAHSGTAVPAGGTAGAGFRLSSTSNFGIFFGSGAPTLSAAQGSLYLRSDGAVNARLYINNNGSTGWSTFNTLT